MHQAPARTVGIAVLLLAACAGAQDKATKPAPGAPPIAAIVNGEPIYVAELEISYQSITRQRELDPARVDRSKAELLDQLINRRLVTQALERQGTLVSPKELDDGLMQLEKQLRQQQEKMTLEQFARSRGVSVDTLRKDLFWQLGWDRYLERTLVDALEEYFNKHKKDLDGTQVRASHILLRPQTYSDTPAQIAARAKKLREAIESGKISFEEAAQRYSAGPSRDRGGDIGFFPRQGVMLDDFAKAAFALDKGQLSEPVTTGFGTHLIRVTDIKSGTKVWTQVIPEIKVLASAELLEELAKKERATAKIEFTGKTPYFKNGTQELVPASVAANPAAK
jgi:parvulin-like peptidyl-prolyl isomerase